MVDLMVADISQQEAGMRMAYTVARRSKDPKTKVGAVLFDQHGNFVQAGYNGFPPGFADTRELWEHETLKHMFAIHAEENCLIRSDFARAAGGTLYVSKVPCVRCLIRADAYRVAKVVFLLEEFLQCQNKQWYKEQKDALEIFDRRAKYTRRFGIPNVDPTSYEIRTNTGG
jgi:dCMP deaminase